MIMTQTKPAGSSASQLQLERVFDTTPENLWSFWTDPKKYAKWIYPGKTDVAMHAFEAKVGGECSFDMLLDTGESMPNSGVFHVLDKPRRLEAGSPDKSFLIVATFEPVGTRGTKLTVTITGVPPDWHQQATVGWNSCFDKLARQIDAPGVSGPARGIVKDGYVEVTRWFNAPPPKVYEAWTDATQLPKFFWPVGTGIVKECTPKPGGRIVMAHAQFDWTATWEFVELVPGKKLVIRDIWPDGSGHTAIGTMDFLPENGGTRMHVHFGPFPKGGPYTADQTAQGAAEVADRLAELVEMPGHGEGFQLVRYFNASPEKVWEMWTTKEGLNKWWALGAQDIGYNFRVEVLEVRVGGKYDLVMQNKEQGELHNHGTYTQVVPRKRLAYRWDFDIFLAPGQKPYPIMVAIDFEEVPTMTGGKGTKMTFRQGPMAKPDFTEGSRQGVTNNFKHLEHAVET